MKEVLYKRRIDPQKRFKTFSIDSKTEDHKCKTQIYKSFKYAVDRSKGKKFGSKPPLIFIRKFFDTKRGIEEFSFHVKGYFSINHHGKLMKVRFYHTLDITIQWKAENFSPKKSASLT